MSDRIEYLASNWLGLLIYSLIFGGFLVLPILGVWFIAIWKIRNKRQFFWAWIPLVLVTITLVIFLGFFVQSVNEGFGTLGDLGGPISPFPSPDFPAVILPSLAIFSIAISPILTVITFGLLLCRNSQKGT